MTQLFVGRMAPRARLTDALAGVMAEPGLPATVLVAGTAGIGKTALVARLAEEATAAGAPVGWGTCWDAQRAPALWRGRRHYAPWSVTGPPPMR